jgi:hypothetical protein
MKTFADKNRVETGLRCTPSNISCKRKRIGKGMKTAKWLALGVICVVVGWFAFGMMKEAIAVTDMKIHHLLTAILVMRWMFVKRASVIKTIILIVIITAIFN